MKGGTTKDETVPVTKSPRSAFSWGVSGAGSLVCLAGVAYAAIREHHKPILETLPPSAEPVLLLTACLVAAVPLAPKTSGILAASVSFGYFYYLLTVLELFGVLPGKLGIFYGVIVAWIAFALLNERVIRPFLRSEAVKKYFGGPLRPAAVAGMDMDRAIMEHEAAPYKKQLAYYQSRREDARQKVVRISKELTAAKAAEQTSAGSDDQEGGAQLVQCLSDYLADLKILEHTMNVRCDEIAGTVNNLLNKDAWNTKWR